MEGARDLQEVEGAFDIGLEKGSQTGDGVIDVLFRGKVEDCGWFVHAEEAGHKSRIADVALNEHVVFAMCREREIRLIPGLGELVQTDQRAPLPASIGPGEPFENKVGTDKAGAFGTDSRGGLRGTCDHIAFILAVAILVVRKNRAGVIDVKSEHEGIEHLGVGHLEWSSAEMSMLLLYLSELQHPSAPSNAPQQRDGYANERDSPIVMAE